MATVRPGIYLEDYRPVRSQFRVGRRDPVRSVIVVHTAESGTDLDGPDPKAEGVANFIRNRSDAGSYHLLGDTDSIIQLVRFENEAYHDRTGSNRWAIGISLAMNAGDWPRLTPQRRTDLVATAAQMAGIAADWLEARGLERPQARLLTKLESDRVGACGFVTHAARDSGRRTDPGPAFPWTEFFEYYSKGSGSVTVDEIKELQQAVCLAGFARAWWHDPDDPPRVAVDNFGAHARYVDGEYGRTTREDVLRAVRAAGEAVPVDAGTVRKAGLWDRFVRATSETASLAEIARTEGARQ